MLLRITKFFFLLLVFSLGYMQPFFSTFGFLIPPADFIFLIICFFWLLAALAKQTFLRWHNFYWLLLFYFAAMALSAVFSIDPRTSLIKLCGEIYLLSLPVLTYNLIFSKLDLKRTMQAWIAGTTVAVTAGLLTIFLFYFDRQNFLLNYFLYHYGAVPVGNYPRVAATFLSASLLCNYLSVSLILLLTVWKLGWIKSVLFYILLALILLVALFTISSNLSGIVLAAGLWIYFVYRKNQKIFALSVLVCSVTIAVLFYAMNFIALQQHSTATFSFQIFGTNFYPSPRLMVWIESLKTFSQNLFFGRGVGQESCRVIFQNAEGSYSVLTDAHNLFLSVAAQSGIFGLTAICAMFIYLQRRISRTKTQDFQLSILKIGFGTAFFSALIYQGLTGSFEDARHLWVLIGLVLVTDNDLSKTVI